MSQRPTMGHNRTGIVTSQGRVEAMLSGMSEFPPTSTGSRAGAGKVRLAYMRAGGEKLNLGSVPPPATIKGVAMAAVDKLKGDEPVLLMDKIGERLAFERTGARLYEALVSKHEADGGFAGGPTRAELVEIQQDEYRHFTMLANVMKQMGGDPTAMTPSADFIANASMGILKVVTDARTSLLQGLEAILIAELADRDGWLALIELARTANKTELAASFEAAEQTEMEHLARVRRWVRAGQERTETVSVTRAL